jgi:hypothetical protein
MRIFPAGSTVWSIWAKTSNVNICRTTWQLRCGALVNLPLDRRLASESCDDSHNLATTTFKPPNRCANLPARNQIEQQP